MSTTLKELAKTLGLSITQVSRALDDKPDVSAKTKAKVREAARQLGYQPNAAARSLRKRKADTIAVVLPAGANHLGLGSLLNMLYDTGDHLASAGIDLIMLPGRRDGVELETIQRIIDGRRADAILIVRTRCNDERVTYLTERGFPFVTHGRTHATVPHAFVDGDGEAGFATATRALFALGHKRIAHLGAPQHMTFARTRRAGWLEAHAAAGITAGLIETISEPSETGGTRGAAELLARKDRPTAMVCATDAMAIGAIMAVRHAGLRPGRDVSIIGHDGLPAGLIVSPTLSTMEIASPDVGRRLAEKLIARLGGADPRDLQEILPIRQVPRESHGPPPR